MSAASDQITQYLSVGGLFNPEMMNQTQHEAVRDTLIKARDEIQSLERENAALRALLLRIRTEKDLLKTRPGAQDQYAGMPPVYRLIDAALAKKS